MGEGEGRQAGEMAQLVKRHARKPKVVPLPSTDLGWGDCCGHPGGGGTGAPWGGRESDVATLGWGKSDVAALGWGCWCTLGWGCWCKGYVCVRLY